MKNNNIFENHSVKEGNPKWSFAIRRENDFYTRQGDIRSDFNRDYNRILHSEAFRRYKHKTQVFFATENDHICTRMEHVLHVAAVSYTLCKYLGLNTELANAIALGHDLGHPPFGHHGEKCLNKLADKNGVQFGHEINSLHFVDKIETLPDEKGYLTNLNLTYAVRDGIALHCGEVDEKPIVARDAYISLDTLNDESNYEPFTWEGCVVKIADKIGYIGRDIEDAFTLNILNDDHRKKLMLLYRSNINVDLDVDSNVISITNGLLMHTFIIDLCKNSTPKEGIRMSEGHSHLLKQLRDFSKEHIYDSNELKIYKEYSGLIINTIYNVLLDIYFSNYVILGKNPEKLSCRSPLDSVKYLV